MVALSAKSVLVWSLPKSMLSNDNVSGGSYFTGCASDLDDVADAGGVGDGSFILISFPNDGAFINIGVIG